MKLFDIVGSEVVISAEALAIPPFKQLWDGDKSKGKSRATKDITYIVFMYKWDSRYRAAYGPDDRDQVLRRDVYGDANHELTPEVMEAAIRYQELQETLNTRLLLATEAQLELLVERFNTNIQRKDMKDVQGNYLVDELSIIKATKDIGNLVKSIELLKQQVQLEQLGGTKVRGDVKVNQFSMPKKKI